MMYSMQYCRIRTALNCAADKAYFAQVGVDKHSVQPIAGAENRPARLLPSCLGDLEG